MTCQDVLNCSCACQYVCLHMSICGFNNTSRHLIQHRGQTQQGLILESNSVFLCRLHLIIIYISPPHVHVHHTQLDTELCDLPLRREKPRHNTNKNLQHCNPLHSSVLAACRDTLSEHTKTWELGDGLESAIEFTYFCILLCTLPKNTNHAHQSRYNPCNDARIHEVKALRGNFVRITERSVQPKRNPRVHAPLLAERLQPTNTPS